MDYIITANCLINLPFYRFVRLIYMKSHSGWERNGKVEVNISRDYSLVVPFSTSCHDFFKGYCQTKLLFTIINKVIIVSPLVKYPRKCTSLHTVNHILYISLNLFNEISLALM